MEEKMRKRTLSIIVALFIFTGIIISTGTVAFATSNTNQVLIDDYTSIINKYTVAYDNDFYYDLRINNDVLSIWDINPLLSLYTPNNLYYALVDISSDGTPELLIAASYDYPDEYYPYDYVIYDLYGYENGRVKRLFSLEDNWIGERYRYTIRNNGIIACQWSAGAYTYGWYFYTLEQNSATPYQSQFVKYDNSAYRKGTNNHEQGTVISKSEYDSIVSSYKNYDYITWYDIKDLSAINNLIPVQSISVTLNGNELSFDQPPVIKNDRTFVPIRAIAEGLGANVDWDSNNRLITINNGISDTMLYIDSAYCYINGIAFLTDAKPFIENNRTMVPVRLISQVLGCRVEWNGDTKSVIITKKNDSNNESESNMLELKSKAVYKEIENAVQEAENMYGSVCQTVKYNSLLSVTVYLQYDGGDSYFETYLCDTENDRLVSNAEFIRMSGLDETAFIQTVRDQSTRIFEAMYPKQEYLQYVSESFYQQQKNNTQTEMCFNNKSPMFLDSAGNIYAVITMPGLAGGDYQYAIDTGLSVK